MNCGGGGQRINAIMVLIILAGVFRAGCSDVDRASASAAAG